MSKEKDLEYDEVQTGLRQLLKDHPKAFVAFVFFGLGLMYLWIFNDTNRKGKKITWQLAEPLWPYVLSTFIGVSGLLLSEPLVIKVCGIFAAFLVFIIAFRTIRFAHFPTEILSPLLSVLKMERGASLIKAVRYVLWKEVRGHQEIELLADIPVKEFLSAFSAKAGNPTIVLAIFLVRYIWALALTILLFGVIIKSSVTNHYFFSDGDFLLASIMRFTSGDDISIVLPGAGVSNWVMAFEGMMSFCYLVIAILAFGTISGHSTEKLKTEFMKIAEVEIANLHAVLTIEVESKRSQDHIEDTGLTPFT